MTIPESSSIHWRAEMYAPERIRIARAAPSGTAVSSMALTTQIGGGVNLGSHLTIETCQYDVDSSDFAEVGGPVTHR